MKTSTSICWIAGLAAAVHGFTAPSNRRDGLQTRKLEIYLSPDPQGCRGLPEGFPEAKVTVVVKEEKQPPKVFDLKTAKATLEAKQSAKSQATTAAADAEIALAQFEAAIEAVLQIEREQVEEAAKSAVEKIATAKSAEASSKQPIDVSIPYDAPARLAYEASDKSMAYADFKVKYEAKAVADVIFKTLGVEKEPELGTVDISIPYDAPARLAYEASDKSMAYADFKQKYQDDAVADVISKKTWVEKEAEDEVVVKEQEQRSAPTDVSKAEALDERGKLATKGIQSYSDFLAPGKFAKEERKDGEPIPPQLRVLSAGYMDQLQKAAQNNPLVLKDELEKRRVVEDDDADPTR